MKVIYAILLAMFTATAYAQTEISSYQFEPIVTPYYKVGKVVIGLPVGQILNGIIREQSNKMRNTKHNQLHLPKR